MYRDDGSGTYSVATAANLWVYDTALLDYRKATVADLLASAASDETSTIYSGATALTPKFASIVASAGGATTVVAAVSLKKIRVVSYTLVANAAVNVKFQSHVTPTDKTGLLYLA